MANWSAQITNKSEVTPEGVMTYEFTPLRDGEPVNGILSVAGTPSDIQQLLEEKVIAFAQAYELADDLPNVGDILQVVTND